MVFKAAFNNISIISWWFCCTVILVSLRSVSSYISFPSVNVYHQFPSKMQKPEDDEIII